MVDQPRSTQRYEARPKDEEVRLTRRMRELARRHPRYGYRRIAALLRAEGWSVNLKRVHRMWRREGLKVPKTKRKMRATGSSRNACHQLRAERKDHVWCWDFAFDRTTSGTALKWLSIVDEFTRECLALKVDRSITSEDVIDTLAELFAMRGVPAHIRSDNGPEFVSKAVQRWLGQLEIDALYIEPGSPWQNGYAESFHSKLRDEFLASEEFENLRSARKLTATFRDEYNTIRPHSSLGYQPPTKFAAACAPAPGRATPSLQPQHMLHPSIPTRLS